MTEHDEKMQRYIAGEMPRDERIAFEDEVLANSEMADRLYADANVTAAIETAARARRERAVAGASATPWWRRPMLRWLAPVAAVAAVVIVVVVGRQPGPEQPPVFRGDDVTIEGFSPQGTVDGAPSEFVWVAIDDASFYRFELYDSASIAVFSTTTDQTALILQSSQTRVPASGYWALTPLNDLRVPSGDTRVIHYTTAE